MNHVDLARIIMDEVPGVGHPGAETIDARVLALLILLEGADDHAKAEGREAKGLGVGVIAKELGVALGTASELVQRATRAGLIERVPTNEHRIHAVALTGKGRTARKRRRGNRTASVE